MSKISIKARSGRTDHHLQNGIRLRARLCTDRHKDCPETAICEIFIAHLYDSVRLMLQSPELDRTDLRILELLQERGNLSAAEVGERLRITASTCWRRIARLEELGV